MRERVAPHNIEAEKSVLGALMLDSSAYDVVQESLAPEDFYKNQNKKIFQTIVELFRRNETVDLLTVSHALTAKGELELVGGLPYLAELAESTLGAANVESYAEIIGKTSLLRKLIHNSQETIEKAYTGQYEDVDSFLNEVESEIFKLAENKKKDDLVTSADIVKAAILKIEELYNRKSDVTGIRSGFIDMDKMTAGLHPGELTIIAARPSMGKTAFSLNIVANACLREKKSVAYFSLEMGREQLMMRMLGSEAKINLSDLRVGKVNDDVWPSLINAASKFTDAKLFIDETSGLSPFDLRAKCRRLKAQYGLDMVLIDYLQLMGMKRNMESREREISEISKTLKAVAKELAIPVVALAQLNRGVENRTDKRPLLSDLRESGSIEQDADVIMMIYRDEYYEKESSEYKGQAEIIIAKHRNGPVGTVRLAFQSNIGQFRDLAPSSMENNMPPKFETKAQSPSPFKKGPVKNFAPGSRSNQ